MYRGWHPEKTCLSPFTCVDFELQLFDLVLQVAQANAVPEQVDENDREGEQGEEEGCDAYRRSC